MKLAVIIPAAGSSRRYNAQAEANALAARSKLDEDLGGRPVLQRTVELFTNLPQTMTVIVAGPADPAAMAAFKDRYADKLGLLGVKLCMGGESHRYETVRNALALVPDSCTHIAVHDAARPACPPDLIERLLDAAEKFPAVIPGLPVADTLKRSTESVADPSPDPLASILGAAPERRFGVVDATVDRSGLFAVQTPQVFTRDLLLRAYSQAKLDSTDDAQLVERLGERVVIVPGDARNLKITHAADLPLIRAILGVRPPEQRPAHMRF
ncbi:MAG: 2-C-methyl-D-erythritol 4-phosphate cytidylyltransferase [bacterium]